MPFSIRSGITVQPVDALFSATSAVCVTGLLTVDTADTFTPVGQAVMAVLIQIGGLGITSIGMGLALAAGRRISLRERTLIREAMNVSSLEGMVRLVRAIIKLTLAFELAGVIPIFAVFAQDYPPLKALGLSVFHSISSFNNAGIDILGGGRSLAPYRDNVLLNLSTCFLIISGGIGFLVMVDVVKCRFRFRKFTLHSKVVVTTTAFLLAAGALLLKFTDPLSWLTAFFLSVSARTAGFATLDLGTLSNAGLFTILILMFIGASPGSTGGGIKTTTIFVLAQEIRCIFSKQRPVHSAVHCLPTPLPRLPP
ncbi:MAG: TrkH family potassium uptake protein [Subdoligranulum sp.]